MPLCGPWRRLRSNLETVKILCFDQLRQDFPAVICRISRIIGDAAVIFDEADEARVFTPLLSFETRGK